MRAPVGEARITAKVVEVGVEGDVCSIELRDSRGVVWRIPATEAVARAAGACLYETVEATFAVRVVKR